MTGWLIVNGFLQSAKFDDLYGLLETAFRARGCTLERFPNTAFVHPVGAFPTPVPAPSAPRPDFILFWDKDVALARRFEAFALPVFNSADAVAVCDDKAKTALALSRAGLPTPKTVLGPMTFDGTGYATDGFLTRLGDELGYPFVFKDCYGSFGRQVHLVATPDEARRHLAACGARPFLAQAFVASSAGRDLRVNVVGGETPATLLRTSDRDFRSNVTLGGRATAWTPSPAQRELAVAAARAVGADFAGVDLLFGPDGEPLVCEVNSNPHFRSTLDATGVNLAEIIISYIYCSLLCAS